MAKVILFREITEATASSPPPCGWVRDCQMLRDVAVSPRRQDRPARAHDRAAARRAGIAGSRVTTSTIDADRGSCGRAWLVINTWRRLPSRSGQSGRRWGWHADSTGPMCDYRERGQPLVPHRVGSRRRCHIVVASLPEGDDAAWGPMSFLVTQVVVINKIDRTPPPASRRARATRAQNLNWPCSRSRA
jgi:hypothetical protein